MAKTAFDVARGTTWKIDPDEIRIREGDAEPDPLQRARAALPVSAGLVTLMKRFGFLGVITVSKDGPHAVAEDGRQRVKAAREVKRLQLEEGVPKGKTILVECKLQDGSDAQLTMIGVMLNSGEQRDDSPVMVASQIAHLLSMGQGEQEIADLYVQKISWVKQHRALLTTHQKVQDAVTRGDLSVSGAAKLAKLERTKQVEELAAAREASKSEKVTVRQVSKAIKTKATGKPAIDPPSRKLVLAMADHGEFFLAGVLRWVATGTLPDNKQVLAQLEDAALGAGRDLRTGEKRA